MALTFKSITINDNIHQLTQPGWLWLIPMITMIIIVFLLLKNKYTSKTTPASISQIAAQKIYLHPLINKLATVKSDRKRNFAPIIFYFLIATLLIIALSQPVRLGKKLPEPPQERDITFIVDTSVSMILRDYILDGKRVDRMSLLKSVLSGFINKLKGERMSIIIFGDNAYTLVPLTNDQQLLQDMLSRIKVTMAGRFNAMGDAIALAVKQSIESSESPKKRKRILILLTDADQPTGDINPVVAAQLAKIENLPLYTVAIGATNIAAGENKPGGLLYSPVDLQLTEQLSSITKAKSYHAINSDALDDAIKNINLHESYKREIKVKYIIEPLYYWCLIAAFIIFNFNQLLNTNNLKFKFSNKNKGNQ